VVYIMNNVGVILGLLAIGLAPLVGYTYLRNQQDSQGMVIVRDVSVVEPGLGLRALHAQGYTAKGVNVQFDPPMWRISAQSVFHGWHRLPMQGS
jgi:hypothetical protein